MRHLCTAITLLIVIFWGAMNTLLVQRQREHEQQGLYQRRVNRFLSTSPRRESWVGIYRRADGRSRKMGYSGTIREKVPGVAGTEYHTEMEAALETALFGSASDWLVALVGRGRVRLSGRLTQDDRMRPLQLNLEIRFPGGSLLTVQGQRTTINSENGSSENGGGTEERFAVAIRGSGLDLPPIALPLRALELGGPLAPNLPLAGLREGEEIEISSFNPVFLHQGTTKIKVTNVTTREIGAVLVDVYEIELSLHGVHGTALLTRDGNLVRMELESPLEGVLLRAETATAARRGFRDESQDGDTRPAAGPHEKLADPAAENPAAENSAAENSAAENPAAENPAAGDSVLPNALNGDDADG